MNPFSAFLQPPTQRSPLAGAGEFVQGLQQQALAKRAQQFREQESGLDNARADSYLKLQQAQQAKSFSEADKKEVEAALAEYQDAEDQGDPVRLSRAAQMLKRFGMDVSQGMDPRAGAFTGAKPLPGMLPMAGKSNAFTGTGPDEANPIGDAIATEQATREKLRARTEAPDLSQEDFEADLIANPTSIPESAPDEVIDLDVESPAPLQIGGLPKVSAGTKEFPVPEGTVDGGDLDAVETKSQAPQAAAAMAPALPGGLPVRISKGGKQLYESTGPSGRWAPMVQGVFQAAAQHQDPEFAAAGKRAQEMATKLIGVDGIAPKDAIKFAASQLENEIQNITNFRRTELGTRPKYGIGGGGTGLLGKTQDIAESVQVYDDNARAEAAKIQEEDRQYEAIEAAISSGNPAIQRDAVNVLLKIRSGSAVTASEDARISQINGLIAQVQDRFGRWTGGAMTPEMANTIRQIAALKRQVSAAKIKRIYEHQAKLYEAQNRGKTKDPRVLEERARTLRAGGNTGGSGADAQADALLED